MQRSFSLKKQHAQTLEYQAIRSTNDCNTPVSAPPGAERPGGVTTVDRQNTAQ